MSAATSPSGKDPDLDLRRTSCSAWPPGASGTSGSRFVVYTTSRVAFEGRRRPRQHLLVDASQAVALGLVKQHPFTSKLAELPDCRSIRTTFQTCGTARFRRPDVTLHLWKRS